MFSIIYAPLYHLFNQYLNLGATPQCYRTEPSQKRSSPSASVQGSESHRWKLLAAFREPLSSLVRCEPHMSRQIAVLVSVSVLLACLMSASVAPAAPLESVLVFSETAAFRHDSIPAGITAIQEIGAANDFAVDATEDSTAVHRREPRSVPRGHLAVHHRRCPQRCAAGRFRALHPVRQRLRRHPRRGRHRIHLGLVRRSGGRLLRVPSTRDTDRRRSISRTPPIPPPRRFLPAGSGRTSGTTTSRPTTFAGRRRRLQPALRRPRARDARRDDLRRAGRQRRR